MGWEYVALEWRTGDPKQDTTFRDERREMLDRGWTEHLRAGWPAERMPRQLAGGICIMRMRKGGDMEYDYVAVSWRTVKATDDAVFEHEKASLYAKGWELERCAPWSRENMPRKLAGGACIMRRPKDEPRKWTRQEILDAWCDYLPTMCHPEQELQQRNEALQAVIDKVCREARRLGVDGFAHVYNAVVQYLYPLVTKKEESNG